jgi:hypothetical protein
MRRAFLGMTMLSILAAGLAGGLAAGLTLGCGGAQKRPSGPPPEYEEPESAAVLAPSNAGADAGGHD